MTTSLQSSEVEKGKTRKGEWGADLYHSKCFGEVHCIIDDDACNQRDCA